MALFVTSISIFKTSLVIQICIRTIFQYILIRIKSLPRLLGIFFPRFRQSATFDRVDEFLCQAVSLLILQTDFWSRSMHHDKRESANFIFPALNASSAYKFTRFFCRIFSEENSPRRVMPSKYLLFILSKRCQFYFITRRKRLHLLKETL